MESEKKLQNASNNENINNDKIKEQLIQKSKTLEINKNKGKINNNFFDKSNEIILQKRKNLIERQKKIHKVKTFMNNGWKFKEEDMNQEKYKINFNHNNNHINIIKEINSLSNKRTFFINNISKISKFKDT